MSRKKAKKEMMRNFFEETAIHSRTWGPAASGC
jgi:hypothetical protein